MFASYNSCGSSSKDGYALFDTSTLHTFHRRDISTVSASSFIIVVTVGFVGLLMICAGSSSYYRRRMARGQVLYTQTVGSVVSPVARPQLWEVSLAAAKSPDHSLTVTPGHEWRSIQPMAMRLSSDRLIVDTVDVNVIGRPERPRWGSRRWFGQAPHRATQTYPTSSTSEANMAEIAVLVSLPALLPIPQSPSAKSRGIAVGSGDETATLSASSEQRWARYSLGVAQVPYRGDEESMLLE